VRRIRDARLRDLDHLAARPDAPVYMIVTSLRLISPATKLAPKP
jgi:hypothetical protein